jgi:hypothetical protein
MYWLHSHLVCGFSFLKGSKILGGINASTQRCSNPACHVQTVKITGLHLRITGLIPSFSHMHWIFVSNISHSLLLLWRLWKQPCLSANKITVACFISVCFNIK